MKRRGRGPKRAAGRIAGNGRASSPSTRSSRRAAIAWLAPLACAWVTIVGCGGDSTPKPGGEGLPKGYFDVEVRDADTNELLPTKVTVFDSNKDGAAIIPGNNEGDLVSQKLNEIFLGRGTGRLHIYDGKYDLYFSHGIEYTVFKKHLDVSFPINKQLITLKRVVDTKGYVSADFHIHARPSFESALQPGGLPSLQDRVVHYLVEGVEIMGSSDHQCIVDYAPVIAQLGVGNQIGSLVGVEATPPITAYPSGDGNCSNYDFVPPPLFTEPGHWNAFPLDPGQSYDTNSDKGVTAATLYDRLRKLGSASQDPPLVQLNHPFYELGVISIGWLKRRGYQIGAPIPYNNPLAPNSWLLQTSSEPGSKTRSIDFDAMELWSGASFVYGIPARAAWFDFMNQGLLKVGTANSDSHNTQQTAGYPRNYVQVGTDDPSRVTPKQIASAVRAGKVLGTTGPFITVGVAGSSAGPGDIVPAVNGGVSLQISVQAAPWIPVEELRIYANGALVRETPLGNGDKVVRFNKKVALDVTRDTWVMVEAGATLPEDPSKEPPIPDMYRHVTRDIAPIGYANPVFVDFDGNGKFDAPGLP